MLNHGRTLLLNRDGSKSLNAGILGEEIVPPEFCARFVPTSIRYIRQVLFGAAPDRIMYNYRLRQLTSLLHLNNDLEPFLTDLDPRVSYWPIVDNDFFATSFGTTVTQTHGLGSSELTVVGEFDPPDTSGVMQRSWDIEILTSSIVKTRQLEPPYATEETVYTITNGLSNQISLLGATDISFFFQEALSGTRWTIYSLQQPATDLGVLTAIIEQGLGAANTVQLFGVSRQEPFRTFYNMWTGDEKLPYKLGGLLLAVIYKMDMQECPPKSTGTSTPSTPPPPTVDTNCLITDDGSRIIDEEGNCILWS